jgi:lysyl-tRNA synthetase, class II
VFLAIDALGEAQLGLGRASVAAFTVGLLLTFLGIRANTRLIRANRKWWFHDIESGGGVHVHHMVIGVILMAVTGLVIIAFTPQGLYLQLAALVFGGGVALTLDEFALILRLQDVYWTTEGRMSVDAVVVAVCTGALLVLGIQPLGLDSVGSPTDLAADAAIAATIFFNVFWAVLCLLKGKLWIGFFAIFIPFVGVFGAARLARPRSPWARRRYQGKPAKLARAQRREDRLNATVRAWSTAFFDLIAGKPHLPSLPPAAESDAGDPPAGVREAGGAGADGAGDGPVRQAPGRGTPVSETSPAELANVVPADAEGPATEKPAGPV